MPQNREGFSWLNVISCLCSVYPAQHPQDRSGGRGTGSAADQMDPFYLQVSPDLSLTFIVCSHFRRRRPLPGRGGLSAARPERLLLALGHGPPDVPVGRVVERALVALAGALVLKGGGSPVRLSDFADLGQICQHFSCKTCKQARMNND